MNTCAAVTRKLTGLWLAGLLCWNVVFGASGGLLLCLHEGGAGHLLSSVRSEECCHGESSSAAGIHSESDCASCTDVELTGQEIRALRQGELRSVEVPELPLIGIIDGFYTEFTNDGLSGAVSARVPPEVLAHSVEIAQTIVLRI